jgi:phage tail protein X
MVAGFTARSAANVKIFASRMFRAATGLASSGETHPQRGFHITGPTCESARIVRARSGDTLSWLAARHLGNPDLWLKIWDINPEIEIPSILRAGQAVRIPVPGVRQAS